METRQVLITGANRGIGLELVRQYSDIGCEVYACCRSPENAGELSRLAARSKGKVQIIPLELDKKGAIASLAQSLQGQSIDILFSNAGVYGPASQARLGSTAVDSEEWLRVFSINSIAPLQLVDVLKPNLLLGQQKVVALVSSKMASLADNTSGGAYVYRSSKAALNAVGKSLASDLAAEGIKVALLHPGWVKTDMGGPNALINTQESVTAMRGVLESLTLDTSGSFFNYDGSVLPW